MTDARRGWLPDENIEEKREARGVWDGIESGLTDNFHRCVSEIASPVPKPLREITEIALGNP